jgi:nucleoside-diphosphate-sugar epimerase
MKTSNSISILGCGWLGFPLGKKLLDEGFSVKGSTTNQAKQDDLSKAGITPVLINLSKPDKTNNNLLLETGILVIAVPTSSVNLVNLQTLLQTADPAVLKQIILISSTGIYLDTNAEIAESNADALDQTSKLFAVEQLVKSFDMFNPVVLRMGGLMGYNRQPVTFGKSARVKANPNGRTNMIHRDDAIQLIMQVIKKGVKNETFNCCADEHPTKKEFYTKLAKAAGIAPPVFNAAETDSFKIISNKKVKKVLGFKFKELYKSLEV